MSPLQGRQCSAMSIDILIVDDERDIRDLIAGILEDEGFTPRTASDSDAVFAALRERCPALVILDIWLQGSSMDGLDILDALKQLYPDMPVIIISGHGNIETAIAAIRRGAYDFLEKPFNAEKLILTIGRALEASSLRTENDSLRSKAADEALRGQSTAIQQFRQALFKVAEARSRVLIEGEVGSGRETAAREIHRLSPRRDRPFVVVSAATIKPDTMEEVLFGSTAPDGTPKTIGVFERAHGGTLLIDEVGEMSLSTQAKVLRVLVDQRFTRLGGAAPVAIDTRIISTTSRNLLSDGGEGGFRADLFHRLAVVHLKLPPLRQRPDDVPELVQYLLTMIAEGAGRPLPQISHEAITALQAYDWPGNVRQLRNALERSILLRAGEDKEPMGIADLPEEIVRGGATLSAGTGLEQVISLPLRQAREQFEREYLAAQIARFAGNISRTASFIGMERSALHRKLKALGISGNGKTTRHQSADLSEQ
nr:sigma-54 dependent transcriptional regulator [Parvularcula bermudensis]